MTLFVLASTLHADPPNIDDRDGDGYIAVDRGGDDCVDQYSSVFIEETAECNETHPPVFLDAERGVADHAWFRDASGTFHLYHHAGANSQSIFHVTASDLAQLETADAEPALSPTPGAWDGRGLWAPHVVERDGVYYMFFTGTSGTQKVVQRVGVATSTDLVSWAKYPVNNCPGSEGDGCIYECDESWSAWGNGGTHDAQCRDPFVLWDEAGQRWMMFTTVRLDVPGLTSDAISVATSVDLLHWKGAGFIRATAHLGNDGTSGQRWGGIAENPFVTCHGGTYYLLFTDWMDEDSTNPDCSGERPRCSMVQYASAPHLEATADGSPLWTYRGYTPDRGVNAIEIVVRENDTWIQTQSVVNQNSGDFVGHYRDLRLKRMVWQPDGSYTTSNLTNLVCRVQSSAIHPGASERCDRLDNDCDGRIDEQLLCWQSGSPRRLVPARARAHPAAPPHDPAPRPERRRVDPTRAGLELANAKPTRAGFAGATLWTLKPASIDGTIELRYALGSPGNVRLEIFDVAGRRVRTLDVGMRRPGRYRVRWPGLDSSGSRAARGIYLARLSVDGAVITTKFAKLR